MQRDSRNLDRNRGKEHAKAGTAKRTRRVKAAGNSSQGAGHAIKSRPGSKLATETNEDEPEATQPEGQQDDAGASAKPQRNYTKRPDVVAGENSGQKKQTRTTSPAKTTAKRNAKKAAKAGPGATKGGKRPPGTKPGRSRGASARA
jgi:hypothetical protein